jgi:hypothetical protein
MSSEWFPSEWFCTKNTSEKMTQESDIPGEEVWIVEVSNDLYLEECLKKEKLNDRFRQEHNELLQFCSYYSLYPGPYQINSNFINNLHNKQK